MLDLREVSFLCLSAANEIVKLKERMLQNGQLLGMTDISAHAEESFSAIGERNHVLEMVKIGCSQSFAARAA